MREIHFFLGKGGVGKTTVALAKAQFEASGGKKTLFIEVSSRDSVCDLLDQKPLSYKPRKLNDRLWAIKITGEEALKDYLMRQLRVERIYRLFFENKPVRYFFEAAPILRDLMILGKIVHEFDDSDHPGPYDQIVVDAPATGHGIFLFKTPSVVKQLTKIGPVFQRAKHIADTISSVDRTFIHLVTLPRSLVISETLELHAQMRDLGYPVREIVINRSLSALLRQTKKPRQTSKDLLGILALRAETEKNEIRKLTKSLQLPVSILEENPELVDLVKMGIWYGERDTVANR